MVNVNECRQLGRATRRHTPEESMLLNSHPITLTTITDGHRADLMAEAERDRLWQQARTDSGVPGPGWPKRLAGKMAALTRTVLLALGTPARRATPQTALGLTASRYSTDRDTPPRDECRPGWPQDVHLPAD
jgi:hypothetical protein